MKKRIFSYIVGLIAFTLLCNAQGEYPTRYGPSSGYNADLDLSLALGAFSGYSANMLQSESIGFKSGYICSQEGSTMLGSHSGYNSLGAGNQFIGYKSGADSFYLHKCAGLGVGTLFEGYNLTNVVAIGPYIGQNANNKQNRVWIDYEKREDPDDSLFTITPEGVHLGSPTVPVVIRGALQSDSSAYYNSGIVYDSQNENIFYKFTNKNVEVHEITYTYTTNWVLTKFSTPTQFEFVFESEETSTGSWNGNSELSLEETVNFSNNYKVVNKGAYGGADNNYIIYTNNVACDGMVWASNNFSIWGDTTHIPPAYTHDAPYYDMGVGYANGSYILDTGILVGPYHWRFYVGVVLEVQTNIVDRLVMESVYTNQIYSLKENILDVTVVDGNNLSDAEVKSIVKALRDTLNSF